MRIVHVTNAYAPHSGGIRTTVHALGRGYRARGHEFVLVVPGPAPRDEQLPWGRRITLPGPRVPGTGGYRVLVDLARLRSFLDGLAPDRVEVSDRLSLRRVGDWAGRAGVPSLVIAHERLDGVLRSHLRLGACTARAVADRHNTVTAARFDRVVTTTGFAAREFLRIGAATVRVPLGVDLDHFMPAEPPVHIDDREPLLVLCSRLSREKRPELAVDAVRVLHDRGCAARLVVAGDGPMVRSLQRRSRGLPVTFLGHVSDRTGVARLLATADVVLAPGPVETFGLAALEALACGTPVVAASTSAVAELVAGGGGRCAWPDPESLAGAVLDFLGEPPACRRASARRRAEQYPWQRTSDGMLAVHQSRDTA